MFEGIVAARAACNHCGRRAWVAGIPAGEGALPYSEAPTGGVLWLCSGCIYKLTRQAQLLARLDAPTRQKRRRPPKETRKPVLRDPDAIAPYVGPSKHEVRSLVPAEDEVSP
jgi:hypothetical protein